MDQISLTWYFEEPIDFEHKQYIILSYLQTVDESYSRKIVSPHLLHLEKMSNEMKIFKENFLNFQEKVRRNDYNLLFSTQYNLKNIELDEINEIIDFSKPQIDFRIKNGVYLVKKYKLLYY